jgi:Thaumatin family
MQPQRQGRPRHRIARRIGSAVTVALVAALTAACGGSGAGNTLAADTTWVVPTPSTSAGPSAPASAPPTATASPTPSATPATAKKPTPSPTVPAAAPGDGRTFTIVNALNQTIWVASNRNTTHPLAATGWTLAPGQSTTFAVPNQWGGRIWGRTGCAFDATGHGHCQTGDCGGVYQCVGSGATPATLGEFTLGSWGGMDFYDVSMVDGSNLPMYINISHSTTKDPISPTGCSAAGCTKAVNCPAAMQVGAGACTTPCAAFNTDTYCCRGPWAGRANCIPSKWPVDYTRVFKDAEPYAYSYAYDDSATMSCRGGCNYRITFGLTP